MYKNLMILLIATVLLVMAGNVLALEFTEPDVDDNYYYLGNDSDGNPVYLDEENSFYGSTFAYYDDQGAYVADHDWFKFRVAEGDFLTSIVLSMSNLEITQPTAGYVYYTKLQISFAETVGASSNYYLIQYGGGTDQDWPTGPMQIDILSDILIDESPIGTLDAGYYSVGVLGRYTAREDQEGYPGYEWVNEGGMTADYQFDLTVESTSTAPVPEPATMLLLGTGLAGLAAFRRKFK